MCLAPTTTVCMSMHECMCVHRTYESACTHVCAHAGMYVRAQVCAYMWAFVRMFNCASAHTGFRTGQHIYAYGSKIVLVCMCMHSSMCDGACFGVPTTTNVSLCLHPCASNFMYPPSHVCMRTDVFRRDQNYAYCKTTITIFIRMHKCMHVHTYMCFCTHMCVCACMRMRAHVHVCVTTIATGTCIHMCDCVHTHTYVCTCTPLRAHMCLHNATFATVTLCMRIHKRMLTGAYVCFRMHGCAGTHAGVGMQMFAHRCQLLQGCASK